MKCSVFIVTSADGYIATKTGDITWLEKAGKTEITVDMGFNDFLQAIDCIIMGRKTMEKISSFNLTQEQWPYGNTRIFVLSRKLKAPPENLKSKVEMYSGKIPVLISRLEEEGYHHAYIDGGSTITSFLNLGLIDEMIITQAPILLGEGIPLFGKLHKNIMLSDTQVKVYPNDFIQQKYTVTKP